MPGPEGFAGFGSLFSARARSLELWFGLGAHSL